MRLVASTFSYRFLAVLGQPALRIFLKKTAMYSSYGMSSFRSRNATRPSRCRTCIALNLNLPPSLERRFPRGLP